LTRIEQDDRLGERRHLWDIGTTPLVPWWEIEGFRTVFH
jgi:hypothetical protein